MIYRMIPTSFDVLPKETSEYMCVRKEFDWQNLTNGKYHGVMYTTEGGWNTHITPKGRIYDEAVISAEGMSEVYKCWLRPVEVEGDSYSERLATLLEEVSAEKRDTEIQYGECAKYDILDELETHIMHALEFAEDLDR